MTDPSSRIDTFLAGEYRAADTAINAGRIEQAWCHLERAHIVAQTQFARHLQSHGKMLLQGVLLGKRLKQVLIQHPLDKVFLQTQLLQHLQLLYQLLQV